MTIGMVARKEICHLFHGVLSQAFFSCKLAYEKAHFKKIYKSKTIHAQLKSNGLS